MGESLQVVLEKVYLACNAWELDLEPTLSGVEAELAEAQHEIQAASVTDALELDLAEQELEPLESATPEVARNVHLAAMAAENLRVALQAVDEGMLLDAATRRQVLCEAFFFFMPHSIARLYCFVYDYRGRQGHPLAVILTATNANDVTQLLPLVEAISSVRGREIQPRRRPERVQGDRGCDFEPSRKTLRRLAIEPVHAKLNTPHGSRLGKYR